jgi:hypothetical protein
MVTAGIVVTDLESDSEVDSDVESAGELVVPEVVARHLGRQSPLPVSETWLSTALKFFKPLASPSTPTSVEPAGELVVPEVVAEHQAPLLVSETRPSTALILFKPLSTPPTHTSESEQRRALLRTRRKSRA